MRAINRRSNRESERKSSRETAESLTHRDANEYADQENDDERRANSVFPAELDRLSPFDGEVTEKERKKTGKRKIPFEQRNINVLSSN